MKWGAIYTNLPVKASADGCFCVIENIFVNISKIVIVSKIVIKFRRMFLTYLTFLQ